MARNYTLVPTRPDHPILQRPFLHEVVGELDKLESVALADLDAIEQRVLQRRHIPNPDPDPTPPDPQPIPNPPAAPVNMLPLLQAVRDQGQEGACFAFAGTAAQALCEALASHPPAPVANVYAPADLSWNTRALMGTTDQDSGGNLGDAIQAMEQTGTCLEQFMPYSDKVFATPPDAAADINQGLHKFSGKAYPIDMSDGGQNFLNALAAGYPVYFGFNVWQGFEGTGSDGIVQPPDGTNLGGHANLAYFDPEAPAGTCGDQNSWGESWGVKGRCRFPIKAAASTIIEAYGLVPASPP